MFFKKAKEKLEEKNLFDEYDIMETETDLLLKMLCHQNDRFDITEILKHDYFKNLLDFKIDKNLDTIIEENTIKNSKNEFKKYKKVLFDCNCSQLNNLHMSLQWLIDISRVFTYELQEIQLLLHIFVLHFINLIINKKEITKKNIQLIGISIAYIIMCVSQTLYISIDEYIKATSNKYSEKQIFDCVEEILISFDKSKTDPMDKSKTDPMDKSKTDPMDKSKTDPMDKSKTDPIDKSKTDPMDKFYYITPIYFMNDLINNNKTTDYLIAINISNTTYFNMVMLKYSSYDIAIASINIMNHIVNKKNITFDKESIEYKIIENIKNIDDFYIKTIFENVDLSLLNFFYKN